MVMVIFSVKVVFSGRVSVNETTGVEDGTSVEFCWIMEVGKVLFSSVASVLGASVGSSNIRNGGGKGGGGGKVEVIIVEFGCIRAVGKAIFSSVGPKFGPFVLTLVAEIKKLFWRLNNIITSCHDSKCSNSILCIMSHIEY